MQGTADETSAPPRLLAAVVDDDAWLRQLYVRVLERAGLAVLEGAHGADAVGLRLEHPDLDVMIVNGIMPTMSGPAAIAEIRRLEGERGLRPVQILIDSSSTDLLLDGIDAGADAARLRPGTPGELASLVLRLAGREPATDVRSR